MLRIAVITITYNDDYKFEEWYRHFMEYKNDIHLHVIVDNGSEKRFLDLVRSRFVDSHLIERADNGGCTGAYNDGIRFALSQDDVDAVMLLGNDIRLHPEALRELSLALESDAKLGMVAPVLLKANSTAVEDYGCGISRMLLMKPRHVGQDLAEITPYTNYCQALTGGANMAKRSFYEVVGLQDDKLFMYSDEVDMGIRAAKHGFRLAAVGSALAWHQHINKNSSSRREPFTKYLAGRNKIYLINKHFGKAVATVAWGFYSAASLYKLALHLIKGNFGTLREYYWLIFGATMGLFGKMGANKYSRPHSEA